MLNEIKIKYFLTLADHLSFSAAAQELHITQQALSKQIHQLEEELDCTLFQRMPRGVELTDAGIVMQKTFYSFHVGLDHAKIEIQNNERNNGRVLNIGIAAGLRPGPFLNPLFNSFLKQQQAKVWYGQPESYNDLISWTIGAKFDLAFCTDDFGTDFPELEAIRVCQTPFYFFVGKQHPLASSSAALRDFQNMPFYVTNCDFRTKRIISICAKQKFSPENICDTANPYSTYLMAEAGEAIAFGTGFSSLHTNPDVRGYRIPDEVVHLLCLYSPSQASRLTLQFIDFLRSSVNSEQWYFPEKQ